MAQPRLDSRTKEEIDAQIGRVHRDLDYSGGAVSLVEVRELLRLDIKYYRLDDPGVLDGVVHKLKIGTKQLLARPQLLVEAVRKFDLRALFLPDRRRILIDESTPSLKLRWNESHEVAHSLIPWHQDYMFGDDGGTLSPACHDRIEAEANYGAGQLLFPSKHFHEHRKSAVTSLTTIRAIAKAFGNTFTSTLWRCVEASELPAFGLVSSHPNHSTEADKKVDHLISSPTFYDQFQNTQEELLWNHLRSYCAYRAVGPLGTREVVLEDRNGDRHVFLMESFSIKYNVLTLGTYVRKASIVVPSLAHSGSLPAF